MLDRYASNKGSCIVGPALLVGILLIFNLYKYLELFRKRRMNFFGTRLVFNSFIFLLFFAYKLIVRDCRIYLVNIFYIYSYLLLVY